MSSSHRPLYMSENHLNYYRYCFDTTSPRRIRAAMKLQSMAWRDYLRSPSSRPRRTSSLPDFSSSVKSDLPTTESSPVRSILTDSLSSEPKSEVLVQKRQKWKRFTLRRKSKSWESIAVRKTSLAEAENTGPNKPTNKNKLVKTKNKLKAFFTFLSSSAFWSSYKPTLFPVSRSLSESIRRSEGLVNTADTKKVKNREENKPTYNLTSTSSQSSQSTPSKSAAKYKTKITYCPGPRRRTITNSSSTTTTDDKSILDNPPKDTNELQSEDLKPKRALSEDNASYRIGAAPHEEPDSERFDSSEQDQYSAKRRSRRLVPDLERLGLRREDALYRPSQTESRCGAVQVRHDFKHVTPTSTVVSGNASADYPPTIHWSCSEPEQYDSRGQPGRTVPDLASLGLVKQNLQLNNKPRFKKINVPESKRLVTTSGKDFKKITELKLQHRSDEKRADQRAVNATKQLKDPEPSKEYSVPKGPNGQSKQGAIKKLASQLHLYESVKRKPSKAAPANRHRSRKELFEYLKQSEPDAETPVPNPNTGKRSTNYQENLQQERSQQAETQKIKLDSGKKPSTRNPQHIVEFELTTKRQREKQEAPLLAVQPKRCISKTVYFDSSESGEQEPKKVESGGPKVKQAQEKLFEKEKTQKPIQGEIQQVKYQQIENQRFRSFLWRREFSYELLLDSPFQLIDSEEEYLYQNFKRRYLDRSSPETSLDYSSDPLDIPSDLNLSLEHIDFSESSNEDYYRRRRRSRKHMGRMGSLEDHERKIIIEFCHLLEKSKQLFNGLRELPQYGHKQWHSYFGRTFDVYTKLWKFQQQHRAILDSKYGLKRWQIGEIASKIGQLYYHFYLRTSETAYLNEAFSFYYAIRGRSYYTKACKEDKCELMVKKLRYYARFIVVCLLLKKVKLVRELIKELDRQIIEYGNTYDPDDQIEWTVVVDEVKAFIQAEPVVSVIHPDNYPVILSHRLSSLTMPPGERTSQMNLSLQEILIVGSSSQQVKFSELTIDMFRMLQTLEREPTGDIQHMYDDSPRQRFNLTPSALNNKGYNLETAGPHSENPHKYLLFKPSPSQILVYLASGCNDLPPNGALLLYISADGHIVQSSKHSEDGFDVGGLITTSKNDLHRDSIKEKGSQNKFKEVQSLHPGDLYPFTRRPLFIIIDSDNSYVFQNIPRHFGQPLLILMSPIEVPPSLHASSSDRRQQGSLFTLFLHSPLSAFCYLCDIHTLSLLHWDRGQAYIDTFLAEAYQLLTRSRVDMTFTSFMSDDFLRLLMLRFVFCEVVIRMHRAFRARSQLTRSSPSIPDDLLEHPALTHIIMDLAAHLQVRGNFHDPSTASGPPPAKE